MMSFEPKPGMKIPLNGETIEFVALEASGPAAVFVYAEAGKEGIVYKALKNNKQYALKVFYPEYQDKRLIKNTERVSQFKDLKGFQVAERTVINQKAFPEIVAEYPELNYSVLMPWIQGTVWGNLMTSDRPLQREKYFLIAKILMEIISDLEAQGLAHCDLSNNNFIIDPTLSSIELIDIEDMYAPDMPRPIPDISYGTIGYRTKWIAEHGLWGPKSDRFAAAILCSEILTWHNKEVRENRAGDTSFFDEDEIGEKSERYQIMKSGLEKLGGDFAAKFEKAWTSKNSDQCPPVMDWMNLVGNLDVSKIKTGSTSTPEEPLVVKNGIAHGVPPKMEISHSLLDFDVLQKSSNNLQLVIENTGGSVLTGSFILAPWLQTSTSRFSIQPGDKRKIVVSVNAGFPKPQTGLEYRAPNAMVIESNAGTEVIGARYKLAKPAFFKTWTGWLTLAGLGIIIFSILFSGIVLLASPNPIIFAAATRTMTLRPSPTTRPTNTRRPTATKIPPTPTPAEVGVAVKNKSYEVTVLNARELKRVYMGSYYYYPLDGYLAIELEVKVKNLRSGTVNVPWGDINVIDINNQLQSPGWVGFTPVESGIEVDPAGIGVNGWKTGNEQVTFNKDVYLRLIWFLAEGDPTVVLFSFDDAPLVRVVIN